MTDVDLVAKKLASIETRVEELRTLAKPGAIETDLREQRFVLYTLQIAIRAAQDVASHIVSDERLGEPNTNRELFHILGRAGWLPSKLATKLTAMVGFRNVVVHGYAEVDLGIVRDALENHLDDLIQFATAIRARL